MPRPSLSALLQKEMTRKDFLSFSAFAALSLFSIGGVIAELFSKTTTSDVTDVAAAGRLTSNTAKTQLGITMHDASAIAAAHAGVAKTTNDLAVGTKALAIAANSDENLAASGNTSNNTPVWSEEFTEFDLLTSTNPGGQWYANPNVPSSMVGVRDPAGSTWDANPNQSFNGIGVLNPFTLAAVTDRNGSTSSGNALTITCTKSTVAIETACGYSAWGGTIVQNADVKYFSVGCYIEVRALFTGNGSNLWPAIWFFAAEGVKSGLVNTAAFAGAEVDLVEPQGSISPGYVSMHMRQSGDSPNTDYQLNGSSDINGGDFYGYPVTENTWASYGFDWQETGLTYYLNGVQVFQETNPVVLSYFNNARLAFRLDYTLQSDSLDSSSVSVSVDYIREWASFAVAGA